MGTDGIARQVDTDVNGIITGYQPLDLVALSDGATTTNIFDHMSDIQNTDGMKNFFDTISTTKVTTGTDGTPTLSDATQPQEGINSVLSVLTDPLKNLFGGSGTASNAGTPGSSTGATVPSPKPVTAPTSTDTATTTTTSTTTPTDTIYKLGQKESQVSIAPAGAKPRPWRSIAVLIASMFGVAAVIMCQG